MLCNFYPKFYLREVKLDDLVAGVNVRPPDMLLSILEENQCRQLPAHGRVVHAEAACYLRISSNVYFGKPQIFQSILIGEISINRSKIDAAGVPGCVEYDQPHHLLVTLDLFLHVISTEIRHIFWALVRWFRKQKSYNFSGKYYNLICSYQIYLHVIITA